MYIESITLEGFKSYAHRTFIDGFDPQFNAVTGLNGTGKSNILDSICFVLGITNLGQVRATNLQELVFKSGQAGITKATVSINFNNRNKQQSPIGYEHYNEIIVTRQVVVGGQNKYLINGSNATAKRVTDLFGSVQLNVNNPHFLIMQGRITKVLNMKPPEVLSMIEEAAGTRMYEVKRLNALKTIEKKDAKLTEIAKVLSEEITPTLTKLRAEKSAFLEFQRIGRELETLTRVHLAFQYCENKEKMQTAKTRLREKDDEIVKLDERIERNTADMEKLCAEVARKEQERDKETGGKIGELEKKHREAQSTEAKATSVLESKQDSLKSEQKKMKDLQKHKAEDQKLLVTKQKESDKLEGSIKDVTDQNKKDAAELEKAQRRLQALNQGLSANDDGEDATLAEQLMTAKQEASVVQTSIKQAEMKIKHLRPQLQKKEAELRRNSNLFSTEQKNYDALVEELKPLENEFKRLRFDEDAEAALIAEKRDLQMLMKTLRDKVDGFEARYPHLCFEYRDPERNFDRSRVKGLVARLFQLNDVSMATAIEVAAGGKLYHVVVDTESTGKALLQRGELKRRVTIIPLNKISSSVITDAVVNRAKNLVGKDNVQLALSVVGYEEELQAAMEFVFGGTFVCTDMNAAKRVTFNEQIQKKSVTLSGEVFDPQGTLTGGSRPQQSSIVEQLQEFGILLRDFDEKGDRLQQLEQRLAEMEKPGQQFRRLKHQVELKQREVELAKTTLSHTSAHQQMEDVNKLKAEIAECEATIERLEVVRKKAEAKAAELEHKMQNASEYREKELAQAEKALKDAKKRAEASSKMAGDKSEGVDLLKAEIQELVKAVEDYDAQISACTTAIEQYQNAIKEARETVEELKQVVQEADANLMLARDDLKSRNREIAQKQGECEAKRKDSAKSELKIKELNADKEKITNEQKEATKTVEQLIKNYDWILAEEKQFGQRNGPYDFKANDPKDAARRIQKLTEQKEKLGRNVNQRAMFMLDKAEDQYNDLMKKKEIVEADKATIVETIKQLDAEKREAIKKAWKKVNEDFGSTFASLLPGAHAKLAQPAGQSEDCVEGLEIRVAFGNVWKDSLGELSGGQRSLVALSLILAMLLYKPAPIYILDEVDAALDISHTQNIGLLIKTKFQHSQFIIVSLKDNMFNNANVLFRTRFVDGASAVTRICQVESGSRSVAVGSTSKKTAAANQRKGSERPSTSSILSGSFAKDVPKRSRREKQNSADSEENA